MSKEIVGLVPVKGASERVVGKNIRPFADTNLFELKLNQLSKAKGFTEIIVSSEDDSILQAAKDKGYSVHEREPSYSTSDVPMSEVYSYIASEIGGENIAWINVTNPLAESSVYTDAVRAYQEMSDEYDCLLSAVEVQDYVYFRGQTLNFQPNPWPKSQDLEPLISLPFVINILKRKDMIRWGSCVGERPWFYIIDTIDAWDIDFQWDFDFCETVYRKRFEEIG